MRDSDNDLLEQYERSRKRDVWAVVVFSASVGALLALLLLVI